MNYQEIEENLLQEKALLRKVADDLGYPWDFPDFSNDSLILFEKELQNLAQKIREYWIDKGIDAVKYMYKSPDKYKSYYTHYGSEVKYGYERCLEPDFLEERIHEVYSEWTGFTLLFSSAMSSITTVLNMINKVLNKKMVNGCFVGGYFESYNLFNNYNIFGTKIDIVNDTFHLIKENVEELDFYIIEPVKYNLELDITDLEDLLDKLNNMESNKAVFLIIDITLLGNSFDKQSILNALFHKGNILVFFVKSGIKLDQNGFEFANCGMLSMYASIEQYNLVRKLEGYLKSFRATTGVGISGKDLSLLDFPSFGKDKVHSEKILYNTSVLAKEIKLENDFIFQHIAHPTYKSELSYAKSPMVFLRVNTSEESDCKFIIDYIREKIKEITLSIEVGNSFGFRQTRVEYIKTLEKDPKFIIKIAPGSYRGLIFYKIIDTINYISNFHRISELKKI
ncbi:hypothetical protein [Saliterribacillus persicus]|uniref:Uncharacterized protein n=1 Tax=Saliterribacillus persicus TaxID=930114 RepID=A0A368XDH8_9BACI|nr:hypothetical protein [Saliterribacillus persicus]RCW65895.1 hypothetical protein DFR57_110113 [Saliterribacillus persicus]